MFYTGPGVLNFEGRDYAFGEELPSAIPSETIKALKASGKAFETKPHTAAVVQDGGLGALRDQVAAARAELATVTGERDAARESLEQAQNTIKEMSAAALAPTPQAPPAPPQQHAGPKK